MDGPTRLRERAAVFVANSITDMMRGAISCLAQGNEGEASGPTREFLALLRALP